MLHIAPVSASHFWALVYNARTSHAPLLLSCHLGPHPRTEKTDGEITQSNCLAACTTVFVTHAGGAGALAVKKQLGRGVGNQRSNARPLMRRIIPMWRGVVPPPRCGGVVKSVAASFGLVHKDVAMMGGVFDH